MSSMEFAAKMGLIPTRSPSKEKSSSSDSSETFSQLENKSARPENPQTFGPFYRDELAMGDSATGHSSKFRTTSPPMTIGPDPANIIPAPEKDNGNTPETIQTVQYENQNGPKEILAAHCKNENGQNCSQASFAKIEKTGSRQLVNSTSRFSKVNFSISLQADNDPAGKDFPVYRDLIVTIVQASSRHPLHGYDLKFTRAQVLYNGNGDILVIHTPYLQEGCYQVVSDGELTPHPDLPDTFTRQCCLLKRPNTDNMANGSQYILLGELKDVPTDFTLYRDIITDMFLEFYVGKDFSHVVYPILLGCGHRDAWSSQLKVPEDIQPVCLNGNRAAFDSWFELYQLRATPSYEDCFSDRNRFREYMNQRFDTWDHVTTECEYYKQMHTALCQGCRDCMSREAYIDSIKQRKFTTKVANNATLKMLKPDGKTPKTPGRPRKRRKSGKKCWSKRSHVSEERSLMVKAMSSIHPSTLDFAKNKTPRVPEKLKYGFYKFSHPAGEEISANDMTTDHDASSSSLDSSEAKESKELSGRSQRNLDIPKAKSDSTEAKESKELSERNRRNLDIPNAKSFDSTETKESKELSERSRPNVDMPKAKSSRKRKGRVDKAVIHKDTSQTVQEIYVTSDVKKARQDKIPKLSGKSELGSKSSNGKSTLGKRRHTTVELPTASEAVTTDTLTNLNKKDVANELSGKSEISDTLKRKLITTKRQRMVSEASTSESHTPLTSGLDTKTTSTNDKTIEDNNNNNMETETTTDQSFGRSRRNRKRKAVCSCAGCIHSLMPPEKKVRFDIDITKDDTVKQSASEVRAN